MSRIKTVNKHTSQNDQVTNEWIMKLAVKYDVKYGKWLIHVKPQFAGWKWWAIRNAVLDGKLGPTAKISTRSSENYNNLHVICIYCPDFTNKKELSTSIFKKVLGLLHRYYNYKASWSSLY